MNIKPSVPVDQSPPCRISQEEISPAQFFWQESILQPSGDCGAMLSVKLVFSREDLIKTGEMRQRA